MNEKIPSSHSQEQPERKRRIIGFRIEWVGGSKKEVPVYEEVAEEKKDPPSYSLKSTDPNQNTMTQVSREKYEEEMKKMKMTRPEQRKEKK